MTEWGEQGEAGAEGAAGKVPAGARAEGRAEGEPGRAEGREGRKVGRMEGSTTAGREAEGGVVAVGGSWFVKS